MSHYNDKECDYCGGPHTDDQCPRDMKTSLDKTIKDRVTAKTRFILTSKCDSPAKIRKAVQTFNKQKKLGLIKPNNERL